MLWMLLLLPFREAEDAGLGDELSPFRLVFTGALGICLVESAVPAVVVRAVTCRPSSAEATSSEKDDAADSDDE